MNKFLDVVEDISQNNTDKQYKLLMDSVMEVYKIENKILILNVLYSNALL
jgi:hypothetical protein